MKNGNIFHYFLTSGYSGLAKFTSGCENITSGWRGLSEKLLGSGRVGQKALGSGQISGWVLTQPTPTGSPCAPLVKCNAKNVFRLTLVIQIHENENILGRKKQENSNFESSLTLFSSLHNLLWFENTNYIWLIFLTWNTNFSHIHIIYSKKQEFQIVQLRLIEIKKNSEPDFAKYSFQTKKGFILWIGDRWDHVRTVGQKI